MKQSDLDKYTAETQSDGKIVLTPIKRCIQGTVWRRISELLSEGPFGERAYWCKPDDAGDRSRGSFDEVYVLRSDIVEALSHTDIDGCSVLDSRGFPEMCELGLRPTRQHLSDLGFKVGQYPDNSNK